MKNLNLFLLFTILSLANSFAQDTLGELLSTYNKDRIPYISVAELSKTDAILLDAREQEEFNTSHLKGATFVGYDNFKLKKVKKLISNKDAEIVVYCSLGIRSEDIAEKLKKAGFTNVKNLYGGIFEWKNNDLPVYNLEEKETDKVHTFSKEWSIWLTKGIKVYD